METAMFKVGDVVRLKSGGPGMTVTGADEKSVWTSWYNTTKAEIATAFLPQQAVEKVQ
jgi:uncharacterized protein YodC (DUF2158 family)